MTEGILGKWIKTNVAPLMTLAMFASVLFGTYFWIDDRYAMADEVDQLEQRLDIKIQSDFLQQTQVRIWQLKSRLEGNPNDVTAQEDLRKLEEEKKLLVKELDRLKH